MESVNGISAFQSQSSKTYFEECVPCRQTQESVLCFRHMALTPHVTTWVALLMPMWAMLSRLVHKNVLSRKGLICVADRTWRVEIGGWTYCLLTCSLYRKVEGCSRKTGYPICMARNRSETRALCEQIFACVGDEGRREVCRSLSNVTQIGFIPLARPSEGQTRKGGPAMVWSIYAGLGVTQITLQLRHACRAASVCAPGLCQCLGGHPTLTMFAVGVTRSLFERVKHVWSERAFAAYFERLLTTRRCGC